MVELADVAAELYGLVPAEFTAARTSRATEARTGGDAALAKSIGALPKPSVSAAVVNLLVRARPDELGQLFELGAELRAAQENLDRRQLQRLGRARQELVAAIAREGTTVADGMGMTVSPSAVADVEQTLQAALADPVAEAAVLTGCLIRPLASTGLEPVDAAGALAIPLAGDQGSLAVRQGRGASGKSKKPKGAVAGGAQARASGGAADGTANSTEDAAAARGRAAREKAAAERRADAQRAADEALRRSEEAEARLAELEQRIDDLAPRRTALEDELTDLEQKADEVRHALAALARESDRLERERAAAADRADTALARERRARERLDALD